MHSGWPDSTVGTPSAPSIVAPLGDGSQVVALEPPNLDLISVNVNVTPPFTSCAPPMNLSASRRPRIWGSAVSRRHR